MDAVGGSTLPAVGGIWTSLARSGPYSPLFHVQGYITGYYPSPATPGTPPRPLAAGATSDHGWVHRPQRLGDSVKTVNSGSPTYH